MKKWPESMAGTGRGSMFRMGLMLGIIHAVTTTVRLQGFSTGAFFNLEFARLLLLSSLVGVCLGISGAL